jgi:nitrogen fixation NifU-like protein
MLSGEGEDMSDFDRFIEELQKQISERERALYSEQVIAHAHNPRNLGRLELPDRSAVLTGWCGDTMEFYLRVGPRGQIQEVTFMTDGCGPTVACGSMLSSMVKGMSLEEARSVSPQELITALNGLPQESAHCAELAVKTLRQAIVRE